MRVLDRAHSKLVYNRRARVLSGHLAAILPQGATVLDVGAGDGLVDALILSKRPDLRIRGLDVLVRPYSHREVLHFDGQALPCEDRSVDVVMFVDVLHHTSNPKALLGEAARVSRASIVIKDHTREGLLARPTLRLMDWVGNKAHGVALPYNYWRESTWRTTFTALDLVVERWLTELELYPFPAGLLFDRKLHFIARLRKGIDAGPQPR